MKEIEEGIVTYSIDYKETSKIVYLYTKDGKKSILAHGAKNQKKGLLSFITTLNHVKYIKSDKSLPTVIEYELINSFSNLKENFNKVLTASIILDVINNLDSKDNHLKIFNYLIRILNDLNKDCNEIDILIVFLIKMLKVFGIKPDFNTCSKCGKEIKEAKFITNEGLIYCSSCTTVKEIDNEIYQDIIKSYNLDDLKEIYNDLNLKNKKLMLKTLEDYYNKYSSINLKSLRFLIDKLYLIR